MVNIEDEITALQSSYNYIGTKSYCMTQFPVI